ncbi:MAG TPA: DUF4062 domain-containing protein [Pyrinomonadaceae bacterium]|nr:DUF4062 domain-containing protein [Pyrinomonadaceae bacterium]
MNKTVFISSTYDDLKEYRRAVWELLEKFDVNVRGMEQFGARKEAPLATCLAEVEQSDIYLGVFADKEVASVSARYKSQTYFDPPDPDPQSRYEITYSADAKVILLSSKLSEVT